MGKGEEMCRYCAYEYSCKSRQAYWVVYRRLAIWPLV
jgi:hypothetical protein